MLNALLSRLKGQGAAAAAQDEADERRLDIRYDLAGHRFDITDRQVRSVLNVKDLSCRGACGLTDMPVAKGSIVFLRLKDRRFHTAEVRWVRNALIGLQFLRPLDPDFVEKLHASIVKSRPGGRTGRGYVN